MFCFRPCPLEHVAVPVEVSQIAIFAFVIGIDPRPVSVLCLVKSAVIEHLHFLIGVIPCVVALWRVLGKFIGEVDIVITRRHEISTGGVECHAAASVISNFKVSGLTALGGDENHTGRCRSTINGTRRSILENRHGFDVIRIHLCQ